MAADLCPALRFIDVLISTAFLQQMALALAAQQPHALLKAGGHPGYLIVIVVPLHVVICI
jgi:hypothetical protein